MSRKLILNFIKGELMKRNLTSIVVTLVITALGWTVLAADSLIIFRAGTPIKASEVNANFTSLNESKQNRVSMACNDGSAIKEIKEDGGVVCETDDIASGGVGYTAGEGLTLYGTEFSVAFEGPGSEASAARSDHDHFGTTWRGDAQADGAGLAVELAMGDFNEKAAIYGSYSSVGLNGDSSPAGIRGDSQSYSGVMGATEGGFGVYGISTLNGVGVKAASDTGVALEATSSNTAAKFNGNVDVFPFAGDTNSGKLSFGAGTGQMIDLWNQIYGIGVQNFTQYFRTDGQFAWYRGGTHSNTEFNAGGGVTQMRLQENGDLEVLGSVKRVYAGNSYNNATPVAYGHIDANGNLVSGTPNVSSTFNAANEGFEITITGQTYDGTFITIVTPGTTVLASARAVGGKLIVEMRDGANASQKDFSFITYKP
jgi:hypothetical protein